MKIISMELELLESFSFVDRKFVFDIHQLAKKSAKAIFKFRNYNIAYLGELAERWEEKNVIQKDSDVLALILGIGGNLNQSEFYEEQKKVFVAKMAEYLWKKSDFISDLALVSIFQQVSLDDNTDIDNIKKRLQKLKFCHLSLEQQSFMILLISQCADDEYFKGLIFSWLEQISFSIVDPLMEYPFWGVLVYAFQIIGKVTAKDFQKKGIVQKLSAMRALATNEVKNEKMMNYASLFNTDEKTLFILNFVLVRFCSFFFQCADINKKAYIRIRQRAINRYFLSKEEAPQNFLKQVSENEYYNFLFLEMKEIQNDKNFQFIVSIFEEDLLKHLDFSHISFLFERREKYFSKNAKKKIAKYALEKHSKELGKDNFLNLNERAKQWEVEFSETKGYIDACFKHGFIDFNDLESITQKEWFEHAVEYVQNSFSNEEFLNYLEKIPLFYVPVYKKTKNSYYSDERALDTLTHYLKKSKNLEEKKRVYTLYLNGIFEYRPSKYGECLLSLLSDDFDFKTVFQLSESVIVEWEKKIIQDNLVAEDKKIKLQRKFMSEEEKEKERVEKFQEKFKEATYEFEFRDLVKNYRQELENSLSLRETCLYTIQGKMNEKTGRDVGHLLVGAFLIKSCSGISEGIWRQFEEHAMKIAANA